MQLSLSALAELLVRGKLSLGALVLASAATANAIPATRSVTTRLTIDCEV